MGGAAGGSVLHTTDAGAFWSSAQPVLSNVGSLRFVDAGHGWLLDDDGELAGTTNGGSSWSVLDDGGAGLQAFDFVGPTRGFGVGLLGAAMTTTDGGDTWQDQTSPAARDLVAVDFRDASHGIAVGVAGTVLRTIDGGADWLATGGGPANLLHAVAAGPHLSVAVGEPLDEHDEPGDAVAGAEHRRRRKLGTPGDGDRRAEGRLRPRSFGRLGRRSGGRHAADRQRGRGRRPGGSAGPTTSPGSTSSTPLTAGRSLARDGAVDDRRGRELGRAPTGLRRRPPVDRHDRRAARVGAAGRPRASRRHVYDRHPGHHRRGRLVDHPVRGADPPHVGRRPRRRPRLGRRRFRHAEDHGHQTCGAPGRPSAPTPSPPARGRLRVGHDRLGGRRGRRHHPDPRRWSHLVGRRQRHQQGPARGLLLRLVSSGLAVGDGGVVRARSPAARSPTTRCRPPTRSAR